MQDHWYGGGVVYMGLAKGADHVFGGLGNGYYNYFAPQEILHSEYRFWQKFEWDEPSDYGDIFLRKTMLRTGYKFSGDLKGWLLNN